MNSIEKHGHSWLRRLVGQGQSLAALLPMMAAVFIAYFVIGVAMPVLPAACTPRSWPRHLCSRARRRKSVRRVGDLTAVGWPPGGPKYALVTGMLVAPFRRISGSIGHDPAAGSSPAGRGGKLHRPGRI